ncbi:hypothetical protein [Negadavirga shengliensis]|uniref:tRNA (Guanine-N1)-methyltransferase n=1 Tax=Negadavirga shengliensis TaxID=1389218 RepID=A0ABV9T0A5_9BACT
MRKYLNMRVIRTFTIIIMLLVQGTAFGQSEENTGQEPSLDAGPISSQFDYINNVSSNYQEYKVVRRTYLDKLQANITDSLTNYRRQIQELKTELNKQQEGIKALNADLSDTQSSLDRAAQERDSFNFLGFLIHKSVYNNFMWGLVIVLTVILIISYFRFKKSHAVTSETKKTLDELREEFEQHRRNTLERERKLNRQLVDALNKKEA